MTDGQGFIEPSDPAATGLSTKEVARATEIARHFDPRPFEAILQFGAAPQKRMADLAALILAQVRMPGAGPAGNVPTVGMPLIVDALKRARQALLADIAQLELLHEESIICFRETLVYLRAGTIKAEELQAKLATSEEHAADENRLAAVQEARTLVDMVSALGRRIHDLKLTGMLARQAALQTCMLRSNGQALIKAVQNSIQCAQVAIDSRSTVTLRQGESRGSR
jgi:uncharacterized protein YaaN involved in tellurite resistance